ncbi:MAG: HAD hydrolase family protein [Clostridiales bacterium]|nr:HAD hydrolase family protein [Clostridiales bacterium]
MGNAVPSLQRIATHITRSNDDDGIVYALQNIIHVL